MIPFLAVPNLDIEITSNNLVPFVLKTRKAIPVIITMTAETTPTIIDAVNTSFRFPVKIFIDTDENIREICILTLTGVMVYKETEYVNKEINVSEYSAGVYFIKLFTDKGEIIKRFIKK